VEIFANRLIDEFGVSRHGRTKARSAASRQGPATHIFLLLRCFKDVDARDKPGHDDLNQLSQHGCYATGIFPTVSAQPLKSAGNQP
jgi:hypothetical protein